MDIIIIEESRVAVLAIRVSRNQLRQLMKIATQQRIPICEAGGRMLAAGLFASRRKHVNKYQQFSKVRRRA